MLRYALPRLRDFVFMVIIAGALLSGPRMLNTDSDLGRHLTLGNFILAYRQIPTHDLLSYTKAGESRPPYEWLAEVLFALASRLLELDGVVLLSALIIAAAFALTYSDAIQRSGAPIIALFMTLWAASASSLHWLSRPHLFSFVFFAVWLSMLDRVRRGEMQPLWLFPALMLVWANTHGGFVFGFLAYGAYLAGWLMKFLRHSADWQQGRRLLAIGGMSLFASSVTPDLWGNWIATLNNRSRYVLGHTVETMPLNIALLNSWPFLGVLAFTIVLMALQRKTIATAHVFLLGGLAVASFAMARNVPLFAIAAAPLATYWFAQTLTHIQAWKRIEDAFAGIDHEMHGFVWSALTVAAAFGFFFVHLRDAQSTIFQWNSQIFPVEAAAWLEHHPPAGPMFNDINWGGYLIYRLWPGQRVFIDSQTDFYGEAFVRQYADLLDAPDGWEAMVEKYNVDYLLLPPSTPLAISAAQTPGWRIAYQDATAVIVVHR